MDKRFCVFCGERPVDKTNEHVIPEWLIKRTGDPKRRIFLGSLYGMGKPNQRQRVFQNFVFPACDACNGQSNTAIDDPVQDVVEKLLNAAGLSAKEISLLLDFLDKVRVGLWLGYYHQLSGDPYSVRRPLHIRDSVGRSDRMVGIYRIAGEVLDGLMFSGVDIPAFGISPTCFALTINNVVLLNAAETFVFSEMFGLPYALSIRVSRSGSPDEVATALYPGSGRVTPLALQDRFDTAGDIWEGGTEIYQAIVDPGVKGVGAREASPELYQTEHAARILDPSTGRTAPHILRSDSLVPFPDVATREWVPALAVPRPLVKARLAMQLIEMQTMMLLRQQYEEGHAGADKVEAAIQFNMAARERVRMELSAIRAARQERGGTDKMDM
jgi:hypothetical protein